MKKKIVALCLVVAMAAIAIVGGTLAYLTDRDYVENTFTVGNVSIDLYEKTNAYPGMIFQNNLDYSDIMPGDELSKMPIVKNTSETNAAYVRVAVVMNNLDIINKAIDDVYEAKEYTDEQIQAVYDKVFNGWGINYTKREAGARRMWMNTRDNPVLCNVDMIGKVTDNYAMVDMNNAFQTEDEKAKFADTSKHDGILDISLGDPKGYYWDAAKADERVYVFYLKLAPGETYQLFDGLNVPADFTAEQLAMFDDLKIKIYADAIQAAGFEGETAAVDAFTALNEAHPIGWWND